MQTVKPYGNQSNSNYYNGNENKPKKKNNSIQSFSLDRACTNQPTIDDNRERYMPQEKIVNDWNAVRYRFGVHHQTK